MGYAVDEDDKKMGGIILEEGVNGGRTGQWVYIYIYERKELIYDRTWENFYK